MTPNTIFSVVNIVSLARKFTLKDLQLATRAPLIEKGSILVGCIVL